MTTIGGPGGIGGIGGPRGPTGPEGAEPVLRADDVAGDVATDPVGGAAATTALDALAADLAAGRLTAREATRELIDRLVDATGGPELTTAERAELREVLTDLVTHDPHLSGLVGRI